MRFRPGKLAGTDPLRRTTGQQNPQSTKISVVSPVLPHPPGGLPLPLRGNSPCVARAKLSHTGLQPLIKPGVFRQTEAPRQNAPEPAVGKNNFEELLFHCHSFSYSCSYSLGVQTVLFLKHGVWAAFRMGIVDSRHANGNLNAGFAEGFAYCAAKAAVNTVLLSGNYCTGLVCAL